MLSTTIDLISIYNGFQIEQTEEKEKEFIEALTKFKYLVPIIYPEISNSILKKDERIRYPRLNADNQKSYLPVFTNLAELKKWNSKHKEYMTKTFGELTDIVINGEIVDGITINPMEEDIIINSEQIKQI